MKKHILQTVVFGICLLVCMQGSTGQTGTGYSDVLNNFVAISEDTAYQVAEAKLLQLDYAPSHTLDDTVFLLCDDSSDTLAYVYQLQPIGYIVVSAYTALPPVLAYSVTHSCGDHTDDNILFRLIRTDIHLRLQGSTPLFLEQRKKHTNDWAVLLQKEENKLVDRTCQQWPAKGTTTYGGWIETSWTQYDPYNKFCPIDVDSGGRSLAGCPSIAMAGILDYHQTTNHIQFNDTDDYYHNYAGNAFTIDDDFNQYDFLSFPQLNDHLDGLVSHYQQQIPATEDDLAALIFACGVACQQVYHPEGSGTFGVHQAEQAYYRFGFADIELVDDGDSDLYERVQENIKTALPCHLAIVNEQSTAGHNLVIDGYNTDGYYHLNFGWGGSYDGWYLLPEELPFELTFIEGIIVDIFDAYDGSDLKATGVLNWDNCKKGSTQTGSFTIENIGEPESMIDWEIVETPEWGVWTFSQNHGDDLTPEAGPFTIDVSVAAPNRRNRHYTGHITISNTDNPQDFCIVHSSLTTPYLYHFHPYIQLLYNRNPLFRLILTLLE